MNRPVGVCITQNSRNPRISSACKLDRIICLLCVYICHYIFPFYYLDIFFLTHWHRKHYYIKVVESIQFACAGNSGISRVLCNANTYRSIHEGLFFNSRPVLDLKYPLRLPYIHFYFSSQYQNFQRMQIVFFLLLLYSNAFCVSVSKKKCPNNKKEIYNDKYRHTRDRLFGLTSR
jgi:hypothetical protein